MKTFAVAVIALSSALVACGERNDSPIKTSKSDGEQVVQPTPSAPLATADRNTPRVLRPQRTPESRTLPRQWLPPRATHRNKNPASEANSARLRVPGTEAEKA